MFRRVVLFTALVGALAMAPTQARAKGAGAALAGVGRCEAQFQGKALYNCLGGVFGNFADQLATANASAAAEPAARSTASGLRAATTKPAALSVLNRARSVVAGLASRSSGETQRNFNLINSVFSRAIAAINKKG